MIQIYIAVFVVRTNVVVAFSRDHLVLYLRSVKQNFIHSSGFISWRSEHYFYSRSRKVGWVLLMSVCKFNVSKVTAVTEVGVWHQYKSEMLFALCVLDCRQIFSPLILVLFKIYIYCLLCSYFQKFVYSFAIYQEFFMYLIYVFSSIYTFSFIFFSFHFFIIL